MNEFEEYIEKCKSMDRQKQLLSYRSGSVEEIAAAFELTIEDAQIVFEQFKQVEEGYLILRMIYPYYGMLHQGWTYAFGEGLPLLLNTPKDETLLATISEIDHEKHLITLMDKSVFAFYNADSPGW